MLTTPLREQIKQITNGKLTSKELDDVLRAFNDRDEGDAWVAVTERTPALEQEVWMFGTHNKRPFVGYWRDYSKYTHLGITHWQPVPAPPMNSNH